MKIDSLCCRRSYYEGAGGFSLMLGEGTKMNREEAAEKIIAALDVDTEEEAYDLVKQIYPPVSFFKVGMRLYAACGPTIITGLKKMGARVFLDLKFHDIPNTVASTAEVVTSYGVDMFNLHLSGGSQMIRAAAKAAAGAARKLEIPSPLVIGVTVLTSFDEKALREEAGVEKNLEQHVLNLSLLGLENGLNGVVASPREAEIIRKKCGDDFLIVTPGIRPLWSVPDDQRRVLSPRQAIAAGASYLVIGRPIIRHQSPREAVEKILAELTVS